VPAPLVLDGTGLVFCVAASPPTGDLQVVQTNGSRSSELTAKSHRPFQVSIASITQTLCNTLCSTQASYLHSLLNYHTPTRSDTLQTPTCCLLLVFALPLPPVVLVLQPPQSGTLPSGIPDASSTHTFRRLLKTHCFQQAFGSP